MCAKTKCQSSPECVCQYSHCLQLNPIFFHFYPRAFISVPDINCPASILPHRHPAGTPQTDDWNEANQKPVTAFQHGALQGNRENRDIGWCWAIVLSCHPTMLAMKRLAICSTRSGSEGIYITFISANQIGQSRGDITKNRKQGYQCPKIGHVNVSAKKKKEIPKKVIFNLVSDTPCFSHGFLMSLQCARVACGTTGRALSGVAGH